MFHLSIAASIVALAAVQAPHDDLEPCMGVFSWVEPPDPYDLAVREALIGEHPYRKCQVVTLPSFRREWGVYLLQDEETPPTIVFKRLKQPLWGAMMRVLEESSTDGSHSSEEDAQAAAIRQLDVQVDRFTAPVSEETADVLEKVWDGMLARVRYEGEGSVGLDGVTYHVAHWVPGSYSYRSGQTWSPDENTRTDALVKLAEGMCALAEAAPMERRAKEGALSAAAFVLAKRLEQLSESELERRR